MKLSQKLQEWQTQHLISNEQVERIFNYEQNSSRRLGFPGFVWLGVAVIVLGIIALIAANWSSIPVSMRLIGDFVVLAAVGAAAIHYRPRLILFETLLFTFSLLILATIGLIGQTYQTGGTLAQAILLWSVLSLPLLFFFTHRFFPLIWVWATGCAFIYNWLPFFSDNSDQFIFRVLVTVLFSLCIAVILTRWEKCKHIQYEFLQFGLIGVFVAIALTELYITQFRNVTASALTVSANWGLYSLIISLFIALILLLRFQLKPQIWQMRLITPILILAAIMLACLFTPITVTTGAGLAITLCMYLLLTVFYAVNNQSWLYRLGLLCIGLRILWLYAELLGSLLSTAMTIVFIGVIILMIPRAIAKIKAPFLQWIGYKE